MDNKNYEILRTNKFNYYQCKQDVIAPVCTHSLNMRDIILAGDYCNVIKLIYK